jgi:long-chain acyl-CoA synthetase
LHPKEIVSLAQSSCVSASLLTRRQYELIREHCSTPQIAALGIVFLLPEDSFSLNVVEMVAPPGSARTDVGRPEASEIFAGDALMIYTSGTSGAPKGVVLTHTCLLDRAQGAIEVLGITASDRSLITLPLCHVFGLTRQLFPHLLQGAAVHIVSSASPVDLLNYLIDDREITTFSGVPYHFSGMLQRGAGTRYRMRTLRMATSSSMRMMPELRRALAASLPHTTFSSQYGLSETSGFVTALPGNLFLQKPDSVGRAIPGVEIKLLESEASRALGGRHKSVGELLVRGTGVMRCYFNDPGTSEAFTEDGWLKTGDLAWIDADGDITIIGRKRYVIKRAGEFVIPEEVESVIALHGAIAEACVFGVPHRELGESVRAVVVLREEQSVSPQEILEICRRNLAPFKIPEDIGFVAEMQKTSLGKVNKRAIAGEYMARLAANKWDNALQPLQAPIEGDI